MDFDMLMVSLLKTHMASEHTEENTETWKCLIRLHNNNDNSFQEFINWDSWSNCFSSCGLMPSLMPRTVKLTNNELCNMDFLCIFVLITIIRAWPRETVKMASVIKMLTCDRKKKKKKITRLPVRVTFLFVSASVRLSWRAVKPCLKERNID